MIDNKFSTLTWDRLKHLIEGVHKPKDAYYSYPFIVGDGDDTQIRWFYYKTELLGNQYKVDLIRVITLDKRGRCEIRLNPQMDELLLIHKIMNDKTDEFYQSFVDMYNNKKFIQAQQLSQDNSNPDLQSLYQTLKHKYLF